MSHHGKHGYPRTKQIRAERRKSAEEALAKYNLLSLEEKLARLPEDGAKKQRARLEALLLKQQEPPAPVEAAVVNNKNKKSKKEDKKQ